ncbi:hypothetical protein BROUX41_003620 [Berkeleyomyces rouxiae]
MKTKPDRDSRSPGAPCQVKWLTRIVPLVIAGLVGFGIYAAAVHNCGESGAETPVCRVSLVPACLDSEVRGFVLNANPRPTVDYLIRKRHKHAPAAVLLALLFVFFLLAAVCYLRTLYIVKTNPAIVPLLTDATEPVTSEKTRRMRPRSQRQGTAPRDAGVTELERANDAEAWFSTRRVFVCESDGLPRWCSECRQRKPDRAHHSSDLGRCVYKMDHFCPWVGGVVSETSFKFFTQFTIYCFAFCAVVLACNAYGLALRMQLGESADGVSVACIVVSGFFGIFCFLMSCTSIRYILMNQTNIDMMKRGMSVYLAVLMDPIPSPSQFPATGSQPSAHHGFFTKTYPLDATRDLYPGAEGRAEALPAPRTFAILRTEPGENPWDLGWKRNWQQVMGTELLEWLLPLHLPPCTRHDELDAEYPVGALVEQLKKRYRVPGASPSASQSASAPSTVAWSGSQAQGSIYTTSSATPSVSAGVEGSVAEHGGAVLVGGVPKGDPSPSPGSAVAV